MRLGVTATAVAFVLAIIFGATGTIVPAGQAAASGVSTLTILSGPVAIRHAGGAFVSADDGALLLAGDTIKTGADARAVLTYFEGSTVEMEPDSELAIDAARTNANGDTIIVMQQNLGTTWHVVTHLITTGSMYEIHTSTATASVRGTQFTVAVESDGTTTQTTTEGAVADTDAQGTATVLTPPGQQTTTRTGEAPARPAPVAEPDRTVTVTVADENALVVDTLGRANGMKDGKKVLQTPGAQLRVVDGHLVVTLPNVPDGALTTHVASGSSAADVTTKVEDKGRPAVEVKDTVAPGTNSGVDIKRGTGTAPSLEKRTDPKDAPSPKVGTAPPTRPTRSDDQAAT
ncbi:MAG TPA: FecR domain-containing protein, partial [Mycobacteriales bacterium]|nr:FecR domain-containing protein [Mycobacteriales bacterium]